MAQFKVGDKVKLLFKVKSFTSNWANAWVPEMDAAVGTVGTVTRVGHRKNDIDVNFPAVKGRGAFGYPEFALELVKLDSAPDVQTKQVDQDTTVTVKKTPATKSFAKGDRVYVNFSDYWRGNATYDKQDFGFHFVNMDDGRRGGFFLSNLTSIPTTTNWKALKASVLPAVAPASVQQPTSVIRVSSVALNQARATAIQLAKSNSIRRVTADQVRVELDKQGISVKNLAAVFNKDFRNTGVYVSSKQPTRRGGRIAVWEYTGA